MTNLVTNKKGETSLNHSQHDDYYDRSDDLIARVRRAKESAQRKMEEFGDPSEYDITIIQGLAPEEPAATVEKLTESAGDIGTTQANQHLELDTVKLIESDPQSPIEEE